MVRIQDDPGLIHVWPNPKRSGAMTSSAGYMVVASFPASPQEGLSPDDWKPSPALWGGVMAWGGLPQGPALGTTMQAFLTFQQGPTSLCAPTQQQHPSCSPHPWPSTGVQGCPKPSSSLQRAPGWTCSPWGRQCGGGQ